MKIPSITNNRRRVLRRMPIVLLALAGLVACGDSAAPAPAPSESTSADARHWVGTWHSAVRDNQGGTHDTTYRLLIHTAVGGDAVRLRFSNRYGREPLKLRNVSIALPATSLKLPLLDAASVTPLSFGGKSEAVIPPGAELRSDPVAFALPADSDIAVSFYLPEAITNITGKGNSLTTSWSSGPGGGDATADVMGLSLLMPELGWPFLTGLEVVAPGATTVVALGDSITDGAFQLPNGDGRWPDLLNDRIAGSDLAGLRSVVNAGISGNMVSDDRDGNAASGEAAIRRMAWDVFALPNLSHIILFEGINDVTEGVPSATVVEGVRTIIAEAHRRGVKVIVSTITPCFGHPAVDLACLRIEAERRKYNDWVLGSGEPDLTLDFNAAVGTGLTPETWKPHLTVDFLHPNALGLMVMANSIPLDVLR